MERGYIKLWRKIEDSGILKKHKLCVFWIYCLTKATHKPIDIWIGNQQVHLEPGDFPFGRKVAAESLGMGEQEIRTLLKILKMSENLTIKSTNKYSIISIVNWNIYQPTENKTNHQTNPYLTSTQPAPNHKQEHKNKRIKEYSPDFLLFYNSYPNKKAPDDAWKAWNQRNGSRPETSILLEAIEKQIAWRKNNNGQFRPEWKHPATWLRKGSWEDETDDGPGSKDGFGSSYG